MWLDMTLGFLLMVYLTFKYNDAITYKCILPFEVPCESNTQSADNKRLKLGMHLETRGKNVITAWEDLGNPNFPRILFTSVIVCSCDHKTTHVILVCGQPFFI